MSGYVPRFIFRVLHVGPVIALGGKIINDYLFPTKDEVSKGAAIFYGTCGVLLILAGFINTFLLKPKENMKEARKPWVMVSHTKLALSLVCFTPLMKIIVKSTETANAIKFYLVVVFIVGSAWMRFYREYHTQKQKLESAKK